MKKGIVFLVLIISVLVTKAQMNYFIYLQTDNKQTFSVNMNGKYLSSSASGYIVIPKLQKGEHSFTISFPKNEWPKQSFNVLLNNNDEGYMLKNFAEKGWGLFNIQSMDVVMNGDPIKKGKLPIENTGTDIVKNNETQIVKEPIQIVKEPAQKVEEPKEPEVPIVKVATNVANREPVAPTKTETEVIPAVKIEEKVAEKVIETPVAKVPEKTIETPAIKVEEKVAEKITETPVVKVEAPEKIVEPFVEDKPVKRKPGKITKVSTFNDDDGITITYNVETESGVDVVPIFVQRNIEIADEVAVPKSTEKFIEHIELTNPNTKVAEKVEEKTDDPTTAKVATNNANRAPVEQANKATEPEKIVQPVVEKVVEKVAEPIKEEKKEVEKKVENKEDTVKVSEPVKDKIIEKKEEPVVIKVPVIEKSADNNTNNPLNITEAEKSSQASRNITKINSDCIDKKATEDDFFKTRKKIIAEDNDDARVEVALKQFKLKCYSVLQIKNLAVIFLTDEGKYKLVDTAYPYTHESEVYSSLEPLFTDTYYINRFRAMLNR